MGGGPARGERRKRECRREFHSLISAAFHFSVPSIFYFSVCELAGPEGGIAFISLMVSLKEVHSVVHLYLEMQQFQVMLVVKNRPANARDMGDRGSIPGQEYSPEEGKATHSSVLAWRIPWTEDPGRLKSIGLKRVGHN